MERNLLQRELSHLENKIGPNGRDQFWWPDASRWAPTAKLAGLFADPGSGITVYGGNTLQIDPKTGDILVPPGTSLVDMRKHVKELQQDLLDLGFRLKTDVDGKFDLDTECSVREFQIYAKMPNLAAQVQQGPEAYYGELFGSVSNTKKYRGEIDGAVSPTVARLIKHWAANGWKCPVIVQPWEFEGGVRTKIHDPNFQNIWKHKEFKTYRLREKTGVKPSLYVRMVARDFTGYYPGGAGFNEIGHYARYSTWGGPSSEGRGNSSTAITPDDTIGKPWAKLTAGERSTFMAIRAVSKVECEEHLDRMNAYDNAFVSFGPFHWVLGLAKKPTGERSEKVVDGGEIPSFIAFLKEKRPATYDTAFGFFGLGTEHDWGGSGQKLFYSGGIRNYGKGRIAVKRPSGHLIMENGKNGYAMGNYFRNWHWFYRFIMAARTQQPFRAHTWDFGRLRIRDISSIPIKNLGFTDAAGKAKDPSLGEIFTSERAFAIILRLHVRFPAYVAGVNIYNKESSKYGKLHYIIKSSQAQMVREKIESKNFAAWGDRQQEILIEQIIAIFPDPPPGESNVKTTMTTVRDFTYNGVSLSATALSFLFNRDNLPPAPTY